MPKSDEYLTTEQAAKRLGVNRSTLTRWVQEGRLTEAMRLPGATGALLFRPADIEALAAAEAASA